MEDLDCFDLEQLFDTLQGRRAISFYNTGGKRVEVNSEKKKVSNIEEV